MSPYTDERHQMDDAARQTSNRDEERYFNLDDSRNELHQTPGKRSISSIRKGSITSRRQSVGSEDQQFQNEVNLSSLELAPGSPPQTSSKDPSQLIIT